MDRVAGGERRLVQRVKEQGVPARLHAALGRPMGSSAEHTRNAPARERPGSARGRSSGLGLQRRPRCFQEALPEPPGSLGNRSTRPRSTSSPGDRLPAGRGKGAAALQDLTSGRLASLLRRNSRRRGRRRRRRRLLLLLLLGRGLGLGLRLRRLRRAAPHSKSHSRMLFCDI